VPHERKQGKARKKVKVLQSAANRRWQHKNECRHSEERTASIRFLLCSLLSIKPALKGFEAFKKEFFHKTRHISARPVAKQVGQHERSHLTFEGSTTPHTSIYPASIATHNHGCGL
jgi:hypothetical protein